MKKSFKQMVRLLALTAILICGATTFVSAQDFIDISRGAWYYSYVDELSDRGIISGRGDGCYYPLDSVTCTEALKLVMQASGIEIGEETTDSISESFWGNTIIATAENNGIIAKGSIDPRKPATREQIAMFMVNAKGWQNASHMDKVFGDTDSDNAEILYQKGIVSGTAGDKAYYFNGNSNVTRAETSALIYRLFKYEPLKLRELENVTDAEGFLVKDPSTVEDWQKVLVYMGRYNLNKLTITYSQKATKYPKATQDTILKNALSALQDDGGKVYSKYHEYMCYYGGIDLNTTSSTGNGSGYFQVNVTLSNAGFSDADIRGMRSEFFKQAKAAVNSLIASGAITEDMSDYDKAKEVYRWVCEYCEYDKTDDPQRYFGYGAIANKRAVCQGYTALYNAMCKYLGIWCEGLTGTSSSSGNTDSHIWTRASLNGGIYHIDVTFGDTSINPPEAADYSYFCVTDSVISKDHSGWR